MSNNTIKKSSLEQAKANYEEIKKFAQEQIESKINEEVDKKIMQIINEDLNISIDEDGNVDITKDGEEVVSLNAAEEFEDMDEPIDVSDEDEPIDVYDEEENEENMLEMENLNLEQENPAPAPAPTPAETPVAAEAPVEAPAEAPVEEVPGDEIPTEENHSEIDELISTMQTLINLMAQQQGVSPEKGEEFTVVDDEAQGTPAPVDNVAAEQEPALQEDDMQFEIDDFEENSDLLEIVDDEEDFGIHIDGSKLPNPKDNMVAEEEDVIIVDEDEEFSEIDEELEEMLGVGQTLDHSNTLGKLPRQGVENRHKINENKKAQDESKIGELVKENKGLKSELKTLQLERKEFEEAFIQLREQFDEMQTFNGKLALVNKLLMDGGLSFEQRLNVCEQFDNTDSIEDAQKLYKNIIKENNIKVSNPSSKIKSTTTHTAKSSAVSQPLYESAEAKRMKQLAGMEKRSED